MKNNQIVIVAIIIAGLMAQSCEKMSNQIEGIGTITTNTLQLDEFSKIKMEGADNVFISHGDVQEVKVTGHSNIISRIQTDVSNGTWTIELERGSYGQYELTYYITIPILEGVRNTGSGNVTVSDPISVDRMEISLIGSGGFFGFPLTASRCQVDISGSGNCEITVNDDLDVAVDGSGSVYYKGSPIINEDITGSGRVVDTN
jgi:hypothetical protein